MNWRNMQEETPGDMQRVLIRNGDSIGVGIFHNGKLGFGITQVMQLFGPPKNLMIFTQWASYEDVLGERK